MLINVEKLVEVRGIPRLSRQREAHIVELDAQMLSKASWAHHGYVHLLGSEKEIPVFQQVIKEAGVWNTHVKIDDTESGYVELTLKKKRA